MRLPCELCFMAPERPGDLGGVSIQVWVASPPAEMAQAKLTDQPSTSPTKEHSPTRLRIQCKHTLIDNLWLCVGVLAMREIHAH